jgi:transcription elongation GreA/GreB family factor
MPDMKELKLELYNLCLKHITDSIREIEAAITDRREAMHNETKSSMGDKYETTREMLQQDINMNMDRLNKVKADEATLQAINPESLSEIIVPGSLVQCSNGNFYIAISAGHFSIEQTKYYAVSFSSPIGSQLKGKRAGDTFVLNGKSNTIHSVS